MSAAQNEEKVLCLKRDHLPSGWMSETAMVKMTSEEFFEILEGVPFYWLPRSEAETDPRHKQFIPYVLLQTADGLHTGCYRRNGAEVRLHDLWSVGVGGHINPKDYRNGDSALSAIIKNGMEREMSEEFRTLPEETHTVFHGVINEEKTAVGHVHLGLVYRVHLWKLEGFDPGEELDSFTWFETEKIFQKPLELWSRLALNLLDMEWE